MLKSLIPFRRARRAMSSPFEDWLDDLREPFSSALEPFREKGAGLAAVDVFEDENRVMVRAEVPGLSQKDLELVYQDGSLVIRGNKKEEQERKEADIHFREIRYGSFERTIPLRAGLDWGKAKAVCKNGVLDVAIPKAEKEKDKRKIEVKIG